MNETAAPVRSLADLIASGDGEACARWLDSAPAAESVRALARLSDEARERLLVLLSPDDAADVLEQLPEPQAIDAMEEIDAGVAARILGELPSDARADLINELDRDEAEEILRRLDADEAREVRQLAAYEEDVAGGLMITEYLAYPRSASVRDVLDDLEANADRYADFHIQYAYVVDDAGGLVGVLPMRSLLLASRTLTLDELMIPEPIRVGDGTSLEELAATFRDAPFIGLPVVGEGGRLLGVVERSHVERALADEAGEAFRASQGIVGGDELRSMPLFTRSRRRLAWLSVNIGLNVIAASVIALHQDTLEAVIALAVFLPIISDMSGCSGAQAAAVSMRELTLGVTRPGDIFRVLGKEASVGLINGLALGVLIALVAVLWKGNMYLGLVVGSALALNTIVAVLIGGGVPLLLKRLGTDPALASGPVLTTITDMVGFFLVLTFAAVMLAHLT